MAQPAEPSPGTYFSCHFRRQNTQGCRALPRLAQLTSPWLPLLPPTKPKLQQQQSHFLQVLCPPRPSTPWLLLFPVPQTFLHLVSARVAFKAELQGQPLWLPPSQTGLTALLEMLTPLRAPGMNSS